MTLSQSTLFGLGASTNDGSAIPDHYLVPMSKTAIDIYIGNLAADWKHSPFYQPCKADWDGESHPCTIALLEIERHNLYFVNGIIDYNKLIWAYNEASKMISEIPRLPSLKEQLSNAGKFLVGAVAGFFSAGPVGLFTGGAAAVNRILAEEKGRRLARAQALLDPAMNEAQQAVQVLEKQAQISMLKTYGLWAGGALAVTGVVWWMLSD